MATDIVAGRGDEGAERILVLTKGIGADSVLECVGTQQSMMQAIHSTRRGGSMSYVGVSHGVELDGAELFYTHIHLHGGPAPVRRFLPQLMSWCSAAKDGHRGHATQKLITSKPLCCLEHLPLNGDCILRKHEPASTRRESDLKFPYRWIGQKPGISG